MLIRPRRRLLAAALTLAALATAAPAGAATPAKGFEQFAGCPSPAEDPTISICVSSRIKSGFFKLGTRSVGIQNPMTLSGGVNEQLGGFRASPKGGLRGTKQPVPGGLVGITGLDVLVDLLSVEQLQVFALPELVGQPVIGEGISLPLRVRLINPLLGSNCYIGSAANPVRLEMIEGTTSPPPPNKPISGRAPELSQDPETGILHFENGLFVDNSFSAPGASGCVLNLLGLLGLDANALVNLQSGLPAAAGRNETQQEIDIDLAGIESVYP
ncbi:MAG TPA: hypothetical protein VFX45_08290 [Solirubrobacterales bacterium]|nr:hypothetical protein [Solirubrobacterales bacterium]